MTLPEGITGFRRARAVRSSPEVPPKLFARACHLAAGSVGGRIEKLVPAGYPRNYHRAEIIIGDDAYVILCNAFFPWIAFAKTVDTASFRFEENAKLASCFLEAMACEVLSPRWLDSRTSPELLAHLNQAERGQIDYWKPSRIGEILFNSWD